VLDRVLRARADHGWLNQFINGFVGNDR